MALTDYSDLEKEILNAPEPKVLPAGSEVKARIIAIRSGVSDKNDVNWKQPVFDVPADPMVIEFNDFFWDLADRDKLDPKSVQRGIYKFGQLVKCFGIDISRPIDWEQFIGLEGWVILGVKKSDEYGDGNTVKKYIVKK
uniref:Uncharacterized protein n=2 Tax=viral metagenome TaxID=1070528 RepID=A0A6M3LIL6_9ZZZZ